MVALLGQRDELLKLVEAAFDSQIVVRGNEITISGPERETERVSLLFEELIALLAKGHELNASSVGRSIELIKGEEARPTEVLGDIFLTGRGRGIAPKTLGQKRYVDAIRSNTVTFGIGPAGTGKTYLAIALAVAALSEREVARIILTRPAVEAGERLGFLPGDLQAKVDPYLRPLFDALHDMLDADRLASYMDKGMVEVAPLAFMRGRTLNDSFIILDEAQNTSPEQMQMFLTRLGFGSRVVVTGDITQIDLPREQRSGLVNVMKILEGVPDISFIRFSDADVVRHKLVQRIVNAYKDHADATGQGRPE
jgi:phosphate starvation-inducible protein PhoH and related proteins